MIALDKDEKDDQGFPRIPFFKRRCKKEECE